MSKLSNDMPEYQLTKTIQGRDIKELQALKYDPLQTNQGEENSPYYMHMPPAFPIF
jgi:hypothetical protein